MPRQIEIVITKQGVRAVATLLDELAPKTCRTVWDHLPAEGDAYHAKWANNELYTLVPMMRPDPGKENATIYPIPGDVCYFSVPPGSSIPPDARDLSERAGGLVDLAIFYGRNNHLLGPDGYMPGNVFATITENFEALAAACQVLWRAGTLGERIAIRRLG